MKLVKAKQSNRFLIKDEWYEVISTNDSIHHYQHQLLKGSTPVELYTMNL